MRIKELTSLSLLKEALTQHGKLYLLIYKEGSEQSDCALKNLEDIAADYAGMSVFRVNVAVTRDIHPEYHLTSVPNLLEFQDSELRNVYKGCHDGAYLKKVFEKVSYQDHPEGERHRSVTMYTTPSCSYCNSLKAYLRNHKVRFREVDVSRDEAAARVMVSRSGQQGVPQTVIDGQVVIGFDRERINKLLEIQTVE